MRASTPRIETRSEATLDCHTDAVLLREAVGAVGSTYLRGSSGGPCALPSPGLSSASISVGTPTTISEPPPFAVARSTFPAAKVTFVVQASRKVVHAPRPAARAGVHRVPPLAAPAVARLQAAWGAGAFALGATTAALAGHLRGRALESAALSCILAGMMILLVAVAQMRRSRACGGKPRAAGRRR